MDQGSIRIIESKHGTVGLTKPMVRKVREGMGEWENIVKLTQVHIFALYMLCQVPCVNKY